MFYSEEIIEEVRSRNPIVDVIGSYVHLTKKGGGYFGLCPFHNEKTGSFSVSPSRRTYQCFGCGKGGHVITFIMDYENYTFPEALQFLAERGGVELPKQEFTAAQRQEADRRSRLLAMYREAAFFYVRMLRSPQGKIGYDYLKKRGLSDETIRNFGLGYALQSPNALYRYLKEKEYTDAELKESGFFTYRERGVTDKFWNRVMFPIMDTNNRVIGFGGRVMGDGEPKYLNSPETMIFDKSRNLYGLNAAKRSRERFLLVCEGYMDVISMHQAGFTNAVASLGTAFTVQHGMILKRYTEEVVLCYDHDNAGKKAALRAIPILKEAGLRIKVLDLAPYKDPDEFIKALGADAFRARVESAVNAFLFEIACLRETYDFTDPDDKTRFFTETASKLAAFTDEIERNAYTESVAAAYGIDYGVLKARVSEIGNRQGLMQAPEETRKPAASGFPGQKKETGLQKAERMILTDLSGSPEHFQAIRRVLSPSDFSTPLLQDVAACLYDQLDRNALNAALLIDRFIDNEQYGEVTSLLSSVFMEDAEEEERKQALREAVLRVKADSLERKAAAAQDPGTLMELMKQKQDLRNLPVF